MGFLRFIFLIASFGCLGFIAIGSFDLLQRGYLPEQVAEVVLTEAPEFLISGIVLFVVALILPRPARTKTVIVEKKVPEYIVTPQAQPQPQPAGKNRLLVFIEVLAALAAIVAAGVAVYQMTGDPF